MLTIEDVLAAVARVLRNKGLPADRLTPESRLSDLGFASLDLAEVLVILEDAAGAELDPYRHGPVRTISDLARLTPYLSGGSK